MGDVPGACVACLPWLAASCSLCMTTEENSDVVAHRHLLPLAAINGQKISKHIVVLYYSGNTSRRGLAEEREADLCHMREISNQENGSLALALEAPGQSHEQLHGRKPQPVDVQVQLLILYRDAPHKHCVIKKAAEQSDACCVAIVLGSTLASE